MLRTCFLAITILVSSAAAPFAQPKKIEYSVVELPLDKVVEDLSVALGAPIVMSERSSVLVRKWSVSGDARQVLARLVRDFGVVYTFDSVRYELTPAAAVKVQAIPLGGLDAARARSVVATMYPQVSSNALRVSAAHDLLIVSGSPRFVKDVEALIASAKARPEEDGLEIFAFGVRRERAGTGAPAAAPSQAR